MDRHGELFFLFSCSCVYLKTQAGTKVPHIAWEHMSSPDRRMHATSSLKVLEQKAARAPCPKTSRIQGRQESATPIKEYIYFHHSGLLCEIKLKPDEALADLKEGGSKRSATAWARKRLTTAWVGGRSRRTSDGGWGRGRRAPGGGATLGAKNTTPCAFRLERDREYTTRIDT